MNTKNLEMAENISSRFKMRVIAHKLKISHDNLISRRIAIAVTATAPSTTAPNNTAGRWYLAILGLALALIGGIFVWLMTRSFLRAREMNSWPLVNCVILTSEVGERRHDQNSRPEFRHDISFGYEWQGEVKTNNHLTLRGSPWSSNRGLIEARIAQYPVGKTTQCRVNPNDPNSAVLKTDSLAPGYSIWFPGLFVVGGLGITYRAIAYRPRRD
jgi:hypothetical protein